MMNQCNVVPNSQEEYLVKMAHEKHMLEAEESCQTIVFASHEGLPMKYLRNVLLRGF